MLAKSLWGVSFCLSTALLVMFCSYPFSWPFFAPIAIGLALLTYWKPSLGLGVFVLTTIPTLQLPIIMEYPYFSGPEPGFFALWAAISLKNLISHSKNFEIPYILSCSFITYILAILTSAFLVWMVLWNLPGHWTVTLTLDSLTKVFFWRWMNPFHFLRITLLYIEGVAVFFCVLWIYRKDSWNTIRYTSLAFLLIGVLLMGYSTIELLFRGKQISVYPGFGPVFTDRNAYAIFWVIYSAFSVALISSESRKIRLTGFGLTVASWVFCILSLSFTGIVAIHFTIALSLFLNRNYLPFRPKLVNGLLVIFFMCLILVVGGLLVFSSTIDQGTGQDIVFRIEKFIEGGLYRERGAFWLPAFEMVKASPVLGIGPGEAYRKLSRFREEVVDLPKSGSTHENVHNYFLQVATDGGFFTLVPFLIILTCIILRGIKLDPLPSSEMTQSEGQIHNEHSFFSQQLSVSWTRGLVPAVFAILICSQSQHPLLRLEFTVWFWMFCSFIFDSSPSNKPYSKPFTFSLIVVPILVIATGLFLHTYFSPQEQLSSFTYGLNQIGKKDYIIYQTEDVAFMIFTPGTDDLSLEVRPGSDRLDQRAQIEINGFTLEEKLKGGSPWKKVGYELKYNHPINIGIESSPLVPKGYPNHWGGGVLLRFPKKTVEELNPSPYRSDSIIK